MRRLRVFVVAVLAAVLGVLAAGAGTASAGWEGLSNLKFFKYDTPGHICTDGIQFGLADIARTSYFVEVDIGHLDGFTFVAEGPLLASTNLGQLGDLNPPVDAGGEPNPFGSFYTLKWDTPATVGKYIELRFSGSRIASTIKGPIENCTIDSTKPGCDLTAVGTDSSGKKYIEVTARDQGTGLKSIQVTQSTNAATPVPAFTQGTTDPVVVRSTKINQSKPSQLGLRVTDMFGNVTDCDPVLTSVVREGDQTFTGLPRAESKVTILNGDPGLKRVKLVVNGVTFKEADLAAGEVRSFDVAAAMLPGNANTIQISASGKKGASADVVISD